MAVTPNLGLSSPLASAVSGWIARLKADLNLIDQAAAGLSAVTLLTNGGFEVWQRGTGPFSADGAYTADRWRLSIGAGAVLVAPSATAATGASATSLRLLPAVSTSLRLSQVIEGLPLRGAALAFSASVRSDTGGVARLFVSGDGGATFVTSPFAAGTDTWARLSVTAAVVPAATSVVVGVAVDTSAGAAPTIYLDDATLAYGTTALAYAAPHPQAELARCQRYYEIVRAVWVSGYAAAGGDLIAGGVAWKSTKGGIPTVTRTGTWNVVNCAQPVPAATMVDGCTIQAAATAPGPASYTPVNADAALVAEWNPT